LYDVSSRYFTSLFDS